MRIAIIASQQDPASLNIKDHLIRNHRFRPHNDNSTYHTTFTDSIITLHTLTEDSIYAKNLSERINADLYIFASRHESRSGIASLSAHTPGNWGDAQYGGSPGNLCIAPATLIARAIRYLESRAHSGYDIIQECTHHGPSTTRPSLFIEIGSGHQAWQDQHAGAIISDTIMHIIKPNNNTDKIAVGIGGLHHAPNYKKLILDNVAIGHICPKYALSYLTPEMLIQAIDKTMEPVNYIILDWKGLGNMKPRVKFIIDEVTPVLRQRKIEVSRIKEF